MTISYAPCTAEEPLLLVPVINAKWEGYTVGAFIGMDEYNEPRFADRKFYRCSNCRKGTAVQTNFCSHCGAKMEKAEVYPKNK